MGQGNIRHRENDDKARPKGEKNLINKKSNKSDINGVDKEKSINSNIRTQSLSSNHIMGLNKYFKLCAV